MAVRLSPIKDKVKKLLTEYSHLRDDDNSLMASVWRNELMDKGYLYSHFMEVFSDGKLTGAESIRRTRQALQAKHPELRGKKYAERHAHQEVVKNELFDL